MRVLPLPLLLSIGLHTVFLGAVASGTFIPDVPKPDPLDIFTVELIPVVPKEVMRNETKDEEWPKDEPEIISNEKLAEALAENPPASLNAPPAPSAEEWQLASTYTLKNSKRYRYTWAQQVRSMMGTAVEGPDQGAVRFAIEIAPDGTVVRVDTIWSTSDKAEALARAAIANLPKLPPTPTGKPLVFERTISFQPFETGWPPIYKYDCIPDPPKRPYPWAWDGVSTPNPPGYEAFKQARVEPSAPPPTECPDAPEDSLEAEAADMQRQFDMWESSRLKSQK